MEILLNTLIIFLGCLLIMKGIIDLITGIIDLIKRNRKSKDNPPDWIL